VTKSVTLDDMKFGLEHNARLDAQVSAANLSSWLLSRGIAAVTTDDIAVLLGVPKGQVRQRMQRPKSRGEMISPSRGLWMPVEPQYRNWGAPPAIEIIDDLMEFLDCQYYVGWLSAAALLGSSHHAPQVFQVATSCSVSHRTVGRSQMQFYRRSNIGKLATFSLETKSGLVPVSTREVTMLDIASGFSFVGGLNNAANLIVELCEGHSVGCDALLVAAHYYSVASIRRLGWMLERFAGVRNLSCLAQYANSRSINPSRLDPRESRLGEIDSAWGLIINRKIELDV